MVSRDRTGGTDAASGASAGGTHGDDGRLRPEATCFPPEVGDREIADVSAVNQGTSASHQRQALCVLCVFAVQKPGGPSGVGSPRERSDATPFEANICVYLRDLRASCAGGWVAFTSSCLRICNSGERKIRNSKFEIRNRWAEGGLSHDGIVVEEPGRGVDDDKSAIEVHLPYDLGRASGTRAQPGDARRYTPPEDPRAPAPAGRGTFPAIRRRRRGRECL